MSKSRKSVTKEIFDKLPALNPLDSSFLASSSWSRFQFFYFSFKHKYSSYLEKYLSDLFISFPLVVKQDINISYMWNLILQGLWSTTPCIMIYGSLYMFYCSLYYGSLSMVYCSLNYGFIYMVYCSLYYDLWLPIFVLLFPVIYDSLYLCSTALCIMAPSLWSTAPCIIAPYI